MLRAGKDTMAGLWNRALRIADDTPDSRNRLIDFLRVFSIVIVVFGHWLAAVLFVSDGQLQISHALELSRGIHYLTWALQIMPIFFLVGGYSNGKSLAAAQRKGTARRVWLASRYHRLMTPIVPFLIGWSILVPVLGAFVEPDLLKLASQVAAVPLWFLAVYLLAVGGAPWTFAAWQRWRWATVLVPMGIAIINDALRFQGGPAGLLAWSNYLFIWMTIHQLGYYWAERDALLPVPLAAALAGAGLVGLVAFTTFGPYPVALIGVPGEPFSNTTPPTIVLFAQTLLQIGLISLLGPAVKRLLERRAVWAAIVLVSGMIMSLFVWHMTAMVLTIGIAVLAGNAGFGLEPLTAVWWLSRPLWFLAIGVVLVPFVVVFGRYEQRAQSGEVAPKPLALGISIIVSAGGLAASAAFGMARVDEFPLRWWVPLLVIVGTFLAGMFTFSRSNQDSIGV